MCNSDGNKILVFLLEETLQSGECYLSATDVLELVTQWVTSVFGSVFR